jgi:hypothetical protein
MGGKHLQTRGDNSSVPAFSQQQATRDRAARNQSCRDWKWSRLVENAIKRACFAARLGDVGVAVEGSEFACGSVGFHLSVPIVISPTAKFSGEFSAFFNRKQLDGCPDGLKRTHV